MATTTMSPAAAASSTVAARAPGPSALTTSLRVSGPRELLSTTSWPSASAARATFVPMLPAPMVPRVVMLSPTWRSPGAFPHSAALHLGKHRVDDLLERLLPVDDEHIVAELERGQLRRYEIGAGGMADAIGRPPQQRRLAHREGYRHGLVGTPPQDVTVRALQGRAREHRTR